MYSHKQFKTTSARTLRQLHIRRYLWYHQLICCLPLIFVKYVSSVDDYIKCPINSIEFSSHFDQKLPWKVWVYKKVHLYPRIYLPSQLFADTLVVWDRTGLYQECHTSLVQCWYQQSNRHQNNLNRIRTLLQ